LLCLNPTSLRYVLFQKLLSYEGFYLPFISRLKKPWRILAKLKELIK